MKKGGERAKTGDALAVLAHARSFDLTSLESALYYTMRVVITQASTHPKLVGRFVQRRRGVDTCGEPQAIKADLVSIKADPHTSDEPKASRERDEVCARSKHD